MEANRPAEKSFSRVAEAIPDLEFTGERIVPGKTEEALFREHESRYVFAGRYVAGKDVLDVACGTGIGTSYLLKVGARSCIGLDISKEAIDYARAVYNGCAFAESDATRIGLPDESMDVVVSFETIEHIEDQRGFLMNCRRVLRPGGIFIGSTPNRTLSRWEEKNPFHFRELTVFEFREMVSSIFAEVQLYAQKNRIYPLWLGRKILVRTLDKLQLTEPIRRFLRGEPAAELAAVIPRAEFICDSNDLDARVQPFRAPLLFQPPLIITVARKAVS